MGPRFVVAPRFVLLPAFALTLVACAEAPPPPPSVPAVVFPSRAEIARIPAKAPLPGAFGTGDVAVSEWTVESPPLPSDGPYDDGSPWGTLLRDLTKTREATVTLSPAMRCAAAEMARFYLKNRALPVERLRRFIAARCGGEGPNLAPFVWFADAPKGVSDAQIIARAREAFANGTQEALAHGHHRIGLASARDGGRVAVVIAIGDDEARLEPAPRQVDANRKITLRGTARGDYARIDAFMNSGEVGVSRCQSDSRVPAPRFALTCELAPGDPFAWVEIVGQKRGRVMLQDLADVLAYDGDASAIRYEPKEHGAPAPVTSTSAFTSALLDRINGVRRAAKIAPLTLATKQSAENERLAGTILDAALVHDDDTTDRAAIGLLAGWDVEGGTIRDGHFFLGVVAPTRDATAWLDFAVERPNGRLALLDPDARLIAVGPGIPEGTQGLGAAITTYSLFESEDHAAEEALFVRRLAAARADRGLPAPRVIPVSDEMRHLAARVRREEETPMGALNDMLASLAWQSEAPAIGYVLETNDLATVDVPEVFLTLGPLSIALAITHHRAPGAAWGQYVVFMLLPGRQPPATTAAALTPKASGKGRM